MGSERSESPAGGAAGPDGHRPRATPAHPEGAAPTVGAERIVALDVLRGFALMGILVMNIQAFAMPSAAYTNPAAYGDLTGINAAVWAFGEVLFNLKFMAIFSMLFGAGVCLFSDRAMAKTGRSTRLYYRRTGWLLLFGLLHGYLLFSGDILFHYAVCGAFVYLLRHRSPRTLVLLAGGFLVVPTAINLVTGAIMDPAMAAEMGKHWAPSPEALSAEVAGMRGSFADQLAVRVPAALMQQLPFTAIFLGWRVGAMMLIGMALYRSGVITAGRDLRWYRRVASLGLPLGWGLSAYGAYQSFAHDFRFEHAAIYGVLPNHWGSVGAALGYLSLVMIAVERGVLSGLQARLGAAGRMAFTNYIAQSVLAVLVFNATGWFGAVERWQQLVLVVPIVALQLWYSPWWLARFRFGPLEWLWRALTYGTLPPMRRASTHAR